MMDRHRFARFMPKRVIRPVVVQNVLDSCAMTTSTGEVEGDDSDSDSIETMGDTRNSFETGQTTRDAGDNSEDVETAENTAAMKLREFILEVRRYLKLLFLILCLSIVQQKPDAEFSIVHDDDLDAIIDVRFLQYILSLRLTVVAAKEIDSPDLGLTLNDVSPLVVVSSEGGSSNDFPYLKVHSE